MYKNSSQQVVLPSEVPGELSRAELCRTYCMVAAACLPYSTSASRGQGVLSSKDLFRIMLSNVRWDARCGICNSALVHLLRLSTAPCPLLSLSRHHAQCKIAQAWPVF